MSRIPRQACLRVLPTLIVCGSLFGPQAQGTDCNRNGIDDVLEVESGEAPDCNSNGVPDDCDLESVNPILEPSGEITAQASGEPWQIRFADLDSDGDPDCLALFASRDAPSFEVMRNDGAGSFSPGTLVPLEASPESFLVAELDGDGVLDVAVTYPYSPPYGSVHFGAGDGTFPVRAALPMERAAPRIAAADLDGDGVLDLCLGGRDGLTLLRNLGPGEFSRTDLLEDQEFTSLGGGDLDGDGDGDLVAATGAGFAALLNDGTGNLTWSPIAGGYSSCPPVVEDLDGDGDLDIALSLRTTVFVLRNRGDAQFDSAACSLSLSPEFFPDPSWSTLLAADLDGDGRRDLLATCNGAWTPGAISFLRNLGAGAFARGTIVAKTGPYPKAFALLDASEGGVRAAVSRWGGAGISILRTGTGANSSDCNSNGVPDECDVAIFGSADCDYDGIPDSCQAVPDCNGNGVPDRCDILSRYERDCNANGIPDACDVTQGHSADRGGDGTPDECQAPWTDLVRLGFEGCPEHFQGAPGETKAFDVFPTLSVGDAPDAGEPTGWSLSIVVEGARVQAVALEGVRVATVFDHDGDPLTPPLDPFEIDLSEAAFRVAEKASWPHVHPAPPRSEGVVSAVVLDFTRHMALRANSVHRMARITLEVTIPRDAEAASVRLGYLDGLQGSHTPVPNNVTIRGATRTGSVASCAAAIRQVQPFLRCDPNDDLRVDLSDPIWILNELFTGTNPWKTRCPLAADCNGDGTKNISDAIFALMFLFTGGAPPPPPFPACGTGSETDFCEPGSTACP